MHLENSDIRRIILHEHAELRERFGALASLVGRLEHGDAATIDDLSARLHFICDFFLRHIAHEEKILEPVLKKLDAWGQVRTEKMDTEHAQQRAQIARLLAIDPKSQPAEYARGIHAFIDTVLEDMVDEEKTCLSDKVLRDDIIVIDGTTG